MKRWMFATVAFFACATSARAESWTCTHSAPIDNQSTITRFEVSPPDLIEIKFHQPYRIEKNNDYGIVATSSISEVEQGQKQPTVGAVTIVINKVTGEFWWVTAIAGQPAAVNQPVHGKCIKD